MDNILDKPIKDDKKISVHRNVKATIAAIVALIYFPIILFISIIAMVWMFVTDGEDLTNSKFVQNIIFPINWLEKWVHEK